MSQSQHMSQLCEGRHLRTPNTHCSRNLTVAQRFDVPAQDSQSEQHLYLETPCIEDESCTSAQGSSDTSGWPWRSTRVLPETWRHPLDRSRIVLSLFLVRPPRPWLAKSTQELSFRGPLSSPSTARPLTQKTWGWMPGSGLSAHLRREFVRIEFPGCV